MNEPWRLGIGCIGSKAGIALYHGRSLQDQKFFGSPIESKFFLHLRTLIPPAEWSKVTEIISLQGPGPFTGIRLGFALGHGLTLQSKKSFYVQPTLSVIASCSPTFPVVSVVDSGGGWLWVQHFVDANKPAGSIQTLHRSAVLPKNLAHIPLCGWGLDRLSWDGFTVTIDQVLKNLMENPYAQNAQIVAQDPYYGAAPATVKPKLGA